MFTKLLSPLHGGGTDGPAVEVAGGFGGWRIAFVVPMCYYFVGQCVRITICGVEDACPPARSYTVKINKPLEFRSTEEVLIRTFHS